MSNDANTEQTVTTMVGPYQDGSGAQTVLDHHPELEGLVKEASEAARAEFGQDPATKAQAAAHEAGHWVVGETMRRGPYRLLRIEEHLEFLNNPKPWLGLNVPLREQRPDVRHDPGGYLGVMLHVIGGFAGEGMAGHGHLASSIDERMCGEILANSYLIVHVNAKISTAGLAGSATFTAAEIIESERAAFDACRQSLSRRLVLRRTQLREMRRKLTSQDVSAFWLDRLLRRAEYLSPILPPAGA